MFRSQFITALLVLTLGALLVFPRWPGWPGWSGRARTSPGQAAVKGRVELLNAKAKTRNGKVDASGIVVWLDPLGARPRGNHQRQTLVQQGKRFTPHVMAVDFGTEVDFPNYDPFFHNVFSVYNGKRFDLGLYASGETRPVNFNRLGVSYIFCNIHPQMSAVVLTLETPYHAVSDQDGAFTINNVTEGRYRLNLWHERSSAEQLAAQSRVIRVDAANSDLGVIRLSEEGYIPQAHLNKHGEDYNTERNRPLYRRQ